MNQIFASTVGTQDRDVCVPRGLWFSTSERGEEVLDPTGTLNEICRLTSWPRQGPNREFFRPSKVKGREHWVDGTSSSGSIGVLSGVFSSLPFWTKIPWLPGRWSVLVPGLYPHHRRTWKIGSTDVFVGVLTGVQWFFQSGTFVRGRTVKR